MLVAITSCGKKTVNEVEGEDGVEGEGGRRRTIWSSMPNTPSPSRSPLAEARLQAFSMVQPASKSGHEQDPPAGRGGGGQRGRGRGRGGPHHRRDPRSQPPDVQLSKALSYLLRHGAHKEGLGVRSDGFVRVVEVLSRPKVRKVDMGDGGADAKATAGKVDDERVGGREQEGGVGPREGTKAIKGPTMEDVRRVVDDNEKKRFELKWEPMPSSDTSDGGKGKGVDKGKRSLPSSSPLSLSLPELAGCKETRDGMEGEWWIRATQGHSIEMPDLELQSISLDDPTSLPVPERVIHGTDLAAWEKIRQSGGLSIMKRTHIHCASGKYGEEGVISGMRKNCSVFIYVDIKRALQDGIPFHLSTNGVILTRGVGDTGILPMRYFQRVENRKGETLWTLEDASADGEAK